MSQSITERYRYERKVPSVTVHLFSLYCGTEKGIEKVKEWVKKFRRFKVEKKKTEFSL